MSQQIQFNAPDGYTLTGQFFQAEHKKQSFPILIASATGIKQGFYAAFATWLSQQGYEVLTFDFRGIGDSLYTPVQQSTATIQDWGVYDIPAAIDWLLHKTQAEQVVLIGHSAGGQLLGLAENHGKVKKVIAVAGSSGNVQGLTGRTKILGRVMFNVIFPVSSMIKGYAATQFMGMGENLPKGVGKQWRIFCSNKGYAINAIEHGITDYHADIRIPIVSIHASDDEIATVANVKDFLRTYPNATTRYITIQPAEFGHRTVGHMLMFKPSHQNLWSILAQELHN